MFFAKLSKALNKFYFFNLRAVKIKFQLETGYLLTEFIQELNTSLSKKTNLDLESKVAFYGGFNNFFFVEHYNKKVLRLVSKIANNNLLQRENAFLSWQDEMAVIPSITPKWFGFKNIKNSQLSCLTMEALLPPKEITPQTLLDLYKNIGDQTLLLPDFKEAIKTKKGFIFQLDGSSKIIDLLNNFVVKIHEPSAYVFVESYLNDRRYLFKGNKTVFDEIKRTVNDVELISQTIDLELYYGLIHGDFKKGNLLKDSSKNLKMIDLQYYQYGARLWDLAFYCSKIKKDFSVIKASYLSALDLSAVEIKLFILFYIVSNLLHTNKKNIKKTILTRLIPALEYIR